MFPNFTFRHETISPIKVEEGEKEIRNARDDILLWKINPRPLEIDRLPFHRGHFKYQDLHFILSFPKDGTQSLHSAGNSEAAGQSKWVEIAFCPVAKQNRCQTI